MYPFKKSKSSQRDDQMKPSFREKLEKLKTIDFGLAQNRQFLTKSYRDLEKLINKNHQYCMPSIPELLGTAPQTMEEMQDAFVIRKSDMDEEPLNQVSPSKYNLIDSILERSKKIEPYIVGDFNRDLLNSNVNDYQRVNFSQMANQLVVFNRQCPEPKVKIDGQIVFEFQNPNSNRIKSDYHVYTCFKNGSFELVIETMPGQNLLLTTNGKSPHFCEQKDLQVHKYYTQRLTPPCVINCVSICQRWRLPSRNLTIIVKKNINEQQQAAMKKGHLTGMIRPNDPKFDNLELSISNISASNSSSVWHQA